MRVAIDARMLRATGIGRYVSELVERVPVLDAGSEFVVLLRRADVESFEPPSRNVTVAEADWGVYSIAAQRRLPGLLRRLRPDVVHFPHFPVPVFDRTPWIVTIQDLTMVDHRNVRSSRRHRLAYPVRHAAMLRTLRAAVSRSAALITSTAYVRDEVIRRFDGVDAAKTTVTPYGVPLALAAGPPPPPTPVVPTDTYLLYVGNCYPYKNVGAAVDALVRLAPSHPHLRLVVVAARDEFAERVVTRAERAGVGARVTVTGFVEDRDLAALYANAALFVFPSLSEGYGFPGLEAMAHGVPVVAARATCLPETYGDAAAWFDPRDPADLARTIRATLDDDRERARLVAAGRERVADLSWDRTAAATLDVYRRTVAAVKAGRGAVVATSPPS